MELKSYTVNLARVNTVYNEPPDRIIEIFGSVPCSTSTMLFFVDLRTPKNEEVG